MSDLSLALYPDPILSKKCEPIKEITKDIKLFGEQLVELMIEHKGAGLAAPQAGKLIRMFAIMIGGEPHIFVNPEIPGGDGSIKTTEGCLSIPGIRASISSRKAAITLKALDIEGNEMVKRLSGETAIIVAHEADHLDGVTFFERMGSAQCHIKKERYKKWWKKYKKHLEKRK